MGFKTTIQSVSPLTAASKQLRVCAALTLTQLTVTQHMKKLWRVDWILICVQECINASYYEKHELWPCPSLERTQVTVSHKGCEEKNSTVNTVLQTVKLVH